MPFGVTEYLNVYADADYDWQRNYQEFYGMYSFKDKTGNPPQDYTRSYVNLTSSASCQQQAQDSLNQSPIQYRWGFSYQLLLAFIILLLIWTIGIYAMHVDVYMNLRLALHQRDIGLRRAILDVSAKYEERLEGQQDTTMKSDKELKKIIGNEKVAYDNPIVVDDATRRERLGTWWKTFRIKRWARQEWVGLLCSSSSPCSGYWTSFWVGPLSLRGHHPLGV